MVQEIRPPHFLTISAVLLTCLMVSAPSHGQTSSMPAEPSLDSRVTCAGTAVLFNNGDPLSQKIQTILIQQLAEQLVAPRIQQGHEESAEDWLEAANMFAMGRAEIIRGMISANRALTPLYEQTYLDCISESVARIY